MLPACISPDTCSFSARCFTWGEERSYLSSPGFAGWLAALYGSPSCAATQQKSGRKSTAFFCLSHSECAARPTPGSIRFVVEVLGSWMCVMDQHLSSAMDLQSVYKPSAQKSHKDRPWSTTQDSSGPVRPQGKMAGWTMKEAEHVLMDTTFVV